MCCIRVKYCCINFVIAPNVLDAQDIPILELNSDFPDLTNLCVDFMYTLLVFCLSVCLCYFVVVFWEEGRCWCTLKLPSLQMLQLPIFNVERLTCKL